MGSWDEELVGELFWSVGANRILDIHIAPSVMEDFVAWHLTKTAIFTVRSAYHAEWECQLGRHNRM
jgi:hypothetical protein